MNKVENMEVRNMYNISEAYHKNMTTWNIVCMFVKIILNWILGKHYTQRKGVPRQAEVAQGFPVS